MYLLDTNVVFEFRKLHAGKADPSVAQWAMSVDSTKMYLASVTVLELEIGVLCMERKDIKQGRLFRKWYEDFVVKVFADRILAFDLVAARIAGKFHVPDPAPFRYSMIAATALVHNMTVVTRNTGDFVRTGVPVINPWQPH